VSGVDVVLVWHTPLENALMAMDVSAGRIRPEEYMECYEMLDDHWLEYTRRVREEPDKFWSLVSKYPQVLEHVWVSMLLIDIPTFIMWQITRHRMISWMVESHRHVAIKEKPSIPDTVKDNTRLHEAIRFIWLHGYKIYKQLLDEGYPKELARLVLPPVDSRIILASGNLRAWLELLCFRLNANSQKETKLLAEKILEALDKAYRGLKANFGTVCRNMYKYRMPREECKEEKKHG